MGENLRKLLIVLILLFLALFFSILAVNYLKFQGTPLPTTQVAYGFSFSPQVFEQTGLNWKTSYTKLLDRFDWQWVRVSFYWNQMVDQQNQVELANLWFQIEEAAKRNVSVVLSIGAKAPFHPEIYIPEKFLSKLKFGEKISQTSTIGQSLLEIEEMILPQLATSSAITYWQVENEPLAGTVNGWTISEELLTKEIELVRKLDPVGRPIILSHPGPYLFDKRWEKLLTQLTQGDVLAVNYFPKIRAPDLVAFNFLGQNLKISWPDFLNLPAYIWGPFSPDFKAIRNLANRKGINFWILEMQSEPYLTHFKEPRGKVFAFNLEDIRKADEQIRKFGISTIGLWGANWWLLQEEQGNSGWLAEIEKIVGKR